MGAAGFSPEVDSDPELTRLTETSGLKVTRRRCLGGSPSGAGEGWIIGATGVVRREIHSAGALRGVMVEVPELLGGATGELGETELGKYVANQKEVGMVTNLVEAKAIRA